MWDAFFVCVRYSRSDSGLLSCVLTADCGPRRGICGACGLSLSTQRPAALASWRYDVPRDEQPARGRLLIFSLDFREGERVHSQWGHVVITCSCFPPVFCENPQKDTSVWTTTPHHDSSLVPTSSPFHLHFRFAVYFLFIIAHPACAVFVLPPLSPLPLYFATSLTWPIPFIGPLLSLHFLSFSSLISSASLFLSDELKD